MRPRSVIGDRAGAAEFLHQVVNLAALLLWRKTIWQL
jgi:hypothetical protein